jgi:peptidoglycan/LPS O-acetylase OafA/YrhL
MLKRIVRLDPPYLVSMALCLALWYLWAVLPHLHGQAFNPTLVPILLHLGYLNAFFGYTWLNAVYWTLAIEFQYYLGMGLIFAALATPRWAVRLAAFAGMGALAFLIPDRSLVFRYLFVFLLGIATFQYFVGILSARAYVLALLVLAVGCDLTLGPMVAGVSVATALVIAWVRRPIPVLGFLGTISYSLYLIHIPVGERILGLGLAHVHGGPARVLVLLVSLGLTLAAAWLFYLVVERPAQRWSSAIRYGVVGKVKTPRESEATGPVVTGIADP